MTDKTNCFINIKEFYPNKDQKLLEQMADFMDNVKGLPRDQIRQAIASYAKESAEKLNSAHLNILDTLAKSSILNNRIMDPAFDGDIKQAMLSALEQSSSQVKDAGLNVESIQDTKHKIFNGKVKTDLTKIGMIKSIQTGEFDELIADIMLTGKKYTGPMADKINATAGILKDSYKLMNRELNNAGIKVFYRDDYTGPVAHSGTAIRGKFSEWISDITTSLDYQKEFSFLKDSDVAEFEELKRTGNITEKSDNKVVKLFLESYKKITDADHDFTDDNINFTQDYEITKPKEKKTGYKAALENDPTTKPMSISQRRAMQKSFTEWRSGADLVNYNRKWGKYKTLGESFEAYSRSAARDVGLASVFGASPFSGYKMFRTQGKQLLMANGLSSIEAEASLRDVDTAWNMATKPMSVKVGGVGKLAMQFRQASALAVLGKAGITSFFLDPVATARQRRDLFNEGLIKSVYETYKTYLPTLLDANGRKEAADMYLYMQNETMTMVEELGNTGRKMQLAADLTQTLSMGRFFNQVSHITNAKMYLKFLGDFVNNKEMTPQLEADLKKFNIKESDLAVIAKLDTKEFGVRNINRLTPDEFAELSGNATNAEAALFDFQNRVNAWLSDKIKKGAPIPGRRERRYLLGDTLPGTRDGEVRRWVAQFKATSTKVTLDSTIGSARTKNPNLPQGNNVKEMLLKGSSIYATGIYAAHMTTAGAMMLLLNALSKGDEEQLDRFAKGDPGLLLDAFARGGGGLMLGDIVSMNENYLMNIAQFSSPAIGAVAKGVSAIGLTADGNVGKAATQTARSVIPMANHILLDPFWGAMETQSKKRSSKSRLNYLD